MRRPASPLRYGEDVRTLVLLTSLTLLFVIQFASVARHPALLASTYVLVLVPLIIWSWFAMDTTMAILFTCYMVPVNLIDNIMRPLVALLNVNVLAPAALVDATAAPADLGRGAGPAQSAGLLAARARPGAR